jgi:hypothetical protein
VAQGDFDFAKLFFLGERWPARTADPAELQLN